MRENWASTRFIYNKCCFPRGRKRSSATRTRPKPESKFEISRIETAYRSDFRQRHQTARMRPKLKSKFENSRIEPCIEMIPSSVARWHCFPQHLTGSISLIMIAAADKTDFSRCTRALFHMTSHISILQCYEIIDAMRYYGEHRGCHDRYKIHASCPGVVKRRYFATGEPNEKTLVMASRDQSITIC